MSEGVFVEGLEGVDSLEKADQERGLEKCTT